MLTRQRKAYVLEILNREGRIVAKELGQELGLSEDTIRRDLRELAGEGRLQRVHGGALPASPALADFAGRQRVASEGKAAIGRAAARMVQTGQVVFLDGGTTAVQLARQLRYELRATIVTHSPSVAVELVGHPHIDVQIIGGRLFKHSIVAIGTAAADAIARVRADLYFMGVTGVHAEVGLTTGDAEEAAIKHALWRQAGETVVLASREKLGAASPYKIVSLPEISSVMVERGLPDALLEPYRQMGIELLEA